MYAAPRHVIYLLSRKYELAIVRQWFVRSIAAHLIHAARVITHQTAIRLVRPFVGSEVRESTIHMTFHLYCQSFILITLLSMPIE